MKYPLSVLVCIFAIAASLLGQITIDSAGYYPVGTVTARGQSFSGTFSLGSAGVEQSWVFGDFTWDRVEDLQMMAPADAPFDTSFTTATHVECSSVEAEGDYYNYFQVSASAVLGLGQCSPGAEFPTIYSEPVSYLVLPCTYNSAWTSVQQTVFVEGDTMIMTDTSSYTVDGWGTVTTPYGTWPALRIFIERRISTSVGGEIVESFVSLSCTWLNEECAEIVRAFSNPDESNHNFTSGSIRMSGLPLAAEPVRGPVAQQFALGQNYPNPFNPNTTLPVALARSGRVSVDIYDATGRLVSRAAQELPAGNATLRVNGSGWATGAYFARVTAGGQAQTIRMQLVK
jgi:hypothetical protein